MSKWNRQFAGRWQSYLLLLVCTLISATGCAGLGTETGRYSQSGILNSFRAKKQIPQTVAEVKTFYEAGQFEAAYEGARHLRKQDPLNKEARRLEAKIAFDLGLKQKSLQAWQTLAVLPGNSAEIHHEAGMRMVQLNAVSAGVRSLKLAVETAPEQLNYHLDLSSAYLATDNVHTAQAVLLQALRRHPADPQLSIATARLFERQGNWNRAAHYYGVALAADPQNPMLLRQRGRNYYRQSQWKFAQRDFAECESELIAGKHWPALLEYGQTCLKLNQIAAAQRVAMVLNEHSAATPEMSQFTTLAFATPLPQPIPAVTPQPVSPVLETAPQAIIAVAAKEPVTEPVVDPAVKAALETTVAARGWKKREFAPRQKIEQSAHVALNVDETVIAIQTGLDIDQSESEADSDSATDATKTTATDSGWRPTAQQTDQSDSTEQPQSGWKPHRSHDE